VLRSIVSPLKTVGCLINRYRLDHWWVPEMVLNVQSISPRLIFNRHKATGEAIIKHHYPNGGDVLAEVVQGSNPR
jgi:hypothetical protein